MARSKVPFTFKGFMVGAFTPFYEDWSVNTKIIPKYAQFLADAGVPGVLVNGSTSEGPALAVQERKDLAEAWALAAKQTKQHIMVQVAGCPLPDAQDLARHAEKIGADSLLCLPELYFKPQTPQDLIDYLKIISAAAPNTPLVYYHNVLRSGVNINMEQFLNESIGQIPTFHGIKYASKDLSEGYYALQAGRLGGYTVFLAADTVIQPGLAIGFDSFSTATLNMFPEYYVKMVEAMNENRVGDARVIQEKLNAACKIITKDGIWLPTMKVAMNILTPINVGLARAPHKNITEAQQKEMAESLKACAL